MGIGRGRGRHAPGEIELAIPKLRRGSYFPSFLEPRKRSEQALVAVVQEAYVNGVSARKVDRLVEQSASPGSGRTPFRGCAAGSMSRSRCSASARSRAATPMIAAVEEELHAAGVADGLDVVLADAGYWTNSAIEALAAEGLQPLVAPDADRHKEPRPGRRGGLYDFMRRVLASERGGELYRRRQATIEPVFGQIKANRGADRFLRRGRSAVRSEWRLLAATHNLLKLYRHHLATV
jgi:hypothetical protein